MVINFDTQLDTQWGFGAISNDTRLTLVQISNI
jgi:hypothetical protein